MSLFYHLLDEKQQLLTDKGFDEASLGSPDKPGWLMQQLRNHLSIAVRESFCSKEPADFEIKAIGFFNEDKDMVLFNFHFLFDGPEGTLTIPQLDMAYNNRMIQLKLEDSSQLPHSSQVLSIFGRPQLLQRPKKETALPDIQKGKGKAPH